MTNKSERLISKVLQRRVPEELSDEALDGVTGGDTKTTTTKTTTTSKLDTYLEIELTNVLL